MKIIIKTVKKSFSLKKSTVSLEKNGYGQSHNKNQRDNDDFPVMVVLIDQRTEFACNTEKPGKCDF